ncbi:cytochrome P450 [Rhizopogon vinicolor AM-OR11-026]|uniref:Cytochrome P450 n=1 Tax=Rhizopogon vinicolor AM-OR11-026 TaxID=1314800 RepID=A0A1B7MX37_9AGAM|nr:cytochrome P450 [Rhizopogon vinicolor AM-OR11-026]
MLDAELGFYLVTSVFVLAVFVLAGLSWCREFWDNRSHLPLPPGPPSLPIVGSIFSLHDRLRFWMSFNAWRSTYGDLVYARMGNKRILVVNSEEVAKDLFEGRSSIYSDKPHLLLRFGFQYIVVAVWRQVASSPTNISSAISSSCYHPVQLRSAYKMLFSFLQDPTDYLNHFQMFTFSYILSVVYDHEPKDMNDAVARIMQRYLEGVVGGMTPRAIVTMEAFPFLLRLPTWFPCATFKRASVKCLQAGRDVREIPFQMVKEKMSNGQVPPCMVADTMNRMNGFEDEVVETAIKEAASIAFAGAAETNTSTLLVFLLAMVLHPEVQVKAHAEIDRVVGKDRLPGFDDRPALPYVDAILRETFRWYPVFPLGIPHATTTSDIYKGYYIPKGVAVIANTWQVHTTAMAHDEKKYPNPDEFKPERFLHEDGSLTSDTMRLGFGWGRRMCVGQHVADASIWIAIASFLAAFTAHKALDEYGKEIPVVPRFSTGMTVFARFLPHPEKFPCRVVPRFHNASVEALTQLTGVGLSVGIACEFLD